MKNRILIITAILLVFTSSCSKTDEEKAKNSVKNYLENNLNDASSYESVVFEKFKKIPDINFSQVKKQVENKYTKEILQNRFKEFNNVSNLKESDLHYEILHKYRANNSLGAKILEESYFILDKNFNVLITHNESIETTIINTKNKIKEEEEAINDMMNSLDSTFKELDNLK
jgi:hypothetical protein